MAPTISASSKVISPSPNRRVLTERNDGTRSSFASSVTDSLGSLDSFSLDAKSKVGYDSQDEFDLFHQSEVDPAEFLVPPPISYSPVAEAAGISLPPYDPETNYLSPRPRFLHYKPKPRVDPEDAKLLDDSFSSDSREESPQRSDDALSSVTRKDDDNEECESLSTETAVEEIGIESGECNSSSTEAAVVEETDVETVADCSCETPKSRSFFRTKLLQLLVFLTVACFCSTVCDTPMLKYTTSLPNWHFTSHYAPSLRPTEDVNLRDRLSQAAQFGKSNVKEFAELFKKWSADIAVQSSVTRLASKQEDLGFYQVVNFTSTVERGVDHSVSPPIDEHIQDEERSSEVEIGVPEISADTKATVDADAHDDEIYQELETVEQNPAANKAVDDMANHSATMEAAVEEETYREVVEAEVEIGVPEIAADTEATVDEIHQELETAEPNLAANEAVDDREHHSATMEAAVEEDPQWEVAEKEAYDEAIEPKLPMVEEETSSSTADEVVEPPSGGLESAEGEVEVDGADLELTADEKESNLKYPLGIVVAISLLVVVVTAAARSLYKRQSSPPSAAPAATATPPSPPTQLPEVSLVPDFSSNMEFQSRFEEDNTAQAETVHESVPAASSSVQDVPMKSRKTPAKITEEDVYSHERRPRRDSTASSASFGSFTTYEKRSARKGGGQDEAMTPVRRSSRIRSLASP